MKIYHFVFDAYDKLWLETTFLVRRVVGWVAELSRNIANTASNWVGLGLGLGKTYTGI